MTEIGNAGESGRAPSYDDLDDRALLRRFRDGSEDAATALYLRYAKQLQNLANSKTSKRHIVQIDAEGIVQSVFRTFFRRAGSGQYDVDDSDSLWKLLLVIAMNKIRSKATFINAAKRDQKRNVSLESIGELDHSVDGRDAEALEIIRMTIDEFLEAFPEEVRGIILMRIDGYQVEEISEKSQRSKRTVERVLQNFRKTLNEQLEMD